MDPITQLDEVLPLLASMVASLDEGRLEAPTPCAEYDVRGVLTHMVDGATRFAAAFRGEPAAPTGPPADVLGTFPAVLTDLRAALGAPGALERSVESPFGPIPGETFARFIALDAIVHGWDIATATGQPYEPTAEVVAAADAFARVATPEERRGGAFAAAVDPGPEATPIARLAAFTGRQGGGPG